MTGEEYDRFREARIQTANSHSQVKLNEEIDARSKGKIGTGDARGVVILLIAVVLLKPIVDYCVQLYAVMTLQFQSLMAFFGL